MTKSGRHGLAEDGITTYELHDAITEIMQDNEWHSAWEIMDTLRMRGKRISTIRVAQYLRDRYDLIRIPELHPSTKMMVNWRYSKKWK